MSDQRSCAPLPYFLDPTCHDPDFDKTPDLRRYTCLTGPLLPWRIGDFPPELQKQWVYLSGGLWWPQEKTSPPSQVTIVLRRRFYVGLTHCQLVVCFVTRIPDQYVLEQIVVRPQEVVVLGLHLLSPPDHAPCLTVPQPGLALWEEVGDHFLHPGCGESRSLIFHTRSGYLRRFFFKWFKQTIDLGNGD